MPVLHNYQTVSEFLIFCILIVLHLKLIETAVEIKDLQQTLFFASHTSSRRPNGRYWKQELRNIVLSRKTESDFPSDKKMEQVTEIPSLESTIFISCVDNSCQSSPSF